MADEIAGAGVDSPQWVTSDGRFLWHSGPDGAPRQLSRIVRSYRPRPEMDPHWDPKAAIARARTEMAGSAASPSGQI